MNYVDICARLDGHLQGLPNAPPIYFDNSPAATPPQGVFFEAVNLPGTLETLDFCLTQKQQGIYSINVFTPLGGGSGAAGVWVDRLVAHFAHVDLDGVHCRAVQIQRVGKIENHFAINASVNWHA